MLFDYFIILVYTFGLYVIIPLLFFKFIILLWYKPHRPSYAFRNFFTVYGRYAARDEKPERWFKFKRLHNAATIIFILSLLLWIACVVVYKNFSYQPNTPISHQPLQ